MMIAIGRPWRASTGAIRKEGDRAGPKSGPAVLAPTDERQGNVGAKGVKRSRLRAMSQASAQADEAVEPPPRGGRYRQADTQTAHEAALAQQAAGDTD